MRTITTTEEWSSHLEAQPGSGQTVKCYCHERGLDLSSFYRQRRKRVEQATQSFVKVPALLSQRASASPLTIKVGDFTVILDSGSEDLERVFFAMAKAQHVLRSE